jgi:putative transposase
MISKTVAQPLIDLGVTKTHSRLHVSDDNPYSEAQFKTMKYRPDYPDRFGFLADARSWAQAFFTRHNHEHHHTGLGLLTPVVVDYGRAEVVLQRRQQTMHAAYVAHPERFVKGTPKLPGPPAAVWINPPKVQGQPEPRTIP